jgi:Domain of unknown function (DUF4907)
MSQLMQNSGQKNANIVTSISMLLLSGFLLLLSGCRNKMGEINKTVQENMSQAALSEIDPALVTFRSFQNPDSTWGYTILVNSKPYLNYTRIPFLKSGSGFSSKRDAELVAGVIVKKIQNGEMTPKLDKKAIDSLELILKINE